ncbi:MAG: NYN domain-containing protein [Betaproteobacteria bacterium]|nr:NYN domain-containing protein [Betaproteobacteria bacterium]
MAATDTHNLAVFCDFENVAIGLKEANYPDFKIRPILERLLLKGSIVVKKAYCDWDRYKEFKRDLHEAAFELIEIPHVRQSGKNSADIRMVVDALDLCYTKVHIDTFVIISGDSDFSPLISKLKENGKSVIGIGVRGSTSSLLVSNCDEFIFYEDLVQLKPAHAPARKAAAEPAKEAAAEPAAKAPRRKARPTVDKAAATDESTSKTEPNPEDKKNRAIEIVVSTVEKLVAERGGDGHISASLIKTTIKRIRPGFSEAEYGYSAFGKILDDAQKRGALVVEKKEGGSVSVSLPASRA